MHIFLFIAIVLTAITSLIGCSGDSVSSKESGTSQVSLQQSASGQIKAPATSAFKPAVKNEMVFDVPETYLREMQIQTEALKDNGSGAIYVPKVAIQTINNRPSVFVMLANNQFALRHIKVDEETETHVLVRQNIESGEIIVTVGAPKLKTGLQRIMSSHHGHSHGGPGGHSH